MSTFFRLAPPDMNMGGQDVRREYVGLNEVFFVTRAKMNALVRNAFEQRGTKHYFYCWHKPEEKKGGIKYEGCKISSWSADGDGKNARIGFFIDQYPYSVPVDEIVETAMFLFDGPEKFGTTVVESTKPSRKK